MSSPDIAHLFAPRLVPIIHKLVTEGQFGICHGGPRICEMNTGTCEVSDTMMDRFKVVLPHAGSSITWEIIFNSGCPEMAPDFIFEENDFLPDVENMKCWNNWDSQDPRCLLRVIEALLEEYTLYQRDLLKEHSRLQFEYESMLENTVDEQTLEVHVAKKDSNRIGPVNFFVKLPIDFSRIPEYMFEEMTGVTSAFLLVTFPTPNSSKVQRQIYMTPRVECVLGHSEDMRIPAFPSGGCLIDYIPTVCEFINKKIDGVVGGYEKRRDCINSFLSLFESHMVEYDTVSYGSASFLMEWHDFFFGLTVELPASFPKKGPIFQFNSVYHETESGEPYCKVVKDAPYSPRWGGDELAERSKAYILDYVVTFQKGSVTEGSSQP